MKYIGMLSMLFLAGCVHTGVNPPTAPPSLEAAYADAVRKAAVATPDKVAQNLIAITPDNDGLIRQDSSVLMVTWKSRTSYEQNIEPHMATSLNEAYAVWVTTAPQVQKFCRTYWRTHPDSDIEGVELRLKQYLGLHYDWSYDVFVELWVHAADLFRPCVDPEIDDRQCALSFDKDALPAVAGIQDYPAFYKNLFFMDFRYEPGVPWTGLGYTYDWGNPSTIEGASEFIVRPGAPYTISRVTATADYCRPDDW